MENRNLICNLIFSRHPKGTGNDFVVRRCVMCLQKLSHSFIISFMGFTFYIFGSEMFLFIVLDSVM